MDEERKALKANLDDCEHRNTKLELLRRSLEGDIQRTKTLLTDKETEVQVRKSPTKTKSQLTDNRNLQF